MSGEGFELVGRRLEGETGDLGNLGGDLDVETALGVESLCNQKQSAPGETEAERRETHSADSRSTLSELAQTGKDRLYASDTVLNLRNVARELLTESEGGSVLQVGATDLDDVLERLLLGVERLAELLERGDERVGDLDDGRDVHGGREAAGSIEINREEGRIGEGGRTSRSRTGTC